MTRSSIRYQLCYNDAASKYKSGYSDDLKDKLEREAIHTLQAVFITENSPAVKGTLKNSLVLFVLSTTSAEKGRI